MDVTTLLGVAALAVGLPFLPIGSYLGFRPPPPTFSLILLLMMIAFLFVLEGLKQLSYWLFGSGES
jgi:Mg2+-importing ATPase